MAKVSAAEMLRRLQTLKKKNLQNIVKELLIKDEETIIILKEQDYLEGDIYGDGVTLRRYRSVNYELFKSRKNPLAGGAVDLIDTGEFVNAMQLVKTKYNKYIFKNNNLKSKLLEDKYGKDIFGLNQSVFDKYQNDIIRPRFIKELQKILNKS